MSKYRVTIGLCVIEETDDGQIKYMSDSGQVYSNADYADLIGIEAVVSKHKDGFNKAIHPILDDLVQLGIEMADTQGGTPPVRPSRN